MIDAGGCARMAGLKSIANRIAPWRFLLFFALLAAGWVIAMPRLGWSQGLLIGFDVAAILFVASHASTFRDNSRRLRDVAKQNDANRAVLLVVSFLLTVVIMAAMVGELSAADRLDLVDKSLVAVSLVLVWIFGNAVYALHYCHLFYTSDDGDKDSAGLKFPGTKEPLMSDFTYFAYTLGVALATSDTEVTSPHIRKVVTAHCVAAFFFNLGVLALTINVLAPG